MMQGHKPQALLNVTVIHLHLEVQQILEDSEVALRWLQRHQLCLYRRTHARITENCCMVLYALQLHWREAAGAEGGGAAGGLLAAAAARNLPRPAAVARTPRQRRRSRRHQRRTGQTVGLCGSPSQRLCRRGSRSCPPSLHCCATSANESMLSPFFLS